MINNLIYSIFITLFYFLIVLFYNFRMKKGFDVEDTLFGILLDQKRKLFNYKNIYLYSSRIKNCLQTGIFFNKKIFISTALTPEWDLIDYLIAHEMGHIRKKHFEIYSIIFFLNTFILLNLWDLINNFLGIKIYLLQLLIFFGLFYLSGFLGSFISRRFEYLADEYAVREYKLDPKKYIEALIDVTPREENKIFKNHPSLRERKIHLIKKFDFHI